MKISGIIIARNEEKVISDALKSLEFCDELILIDNGSLDKTATIAKKFGAKVYEYKKIASEGSFSEIRNFALTKANSDWVLYLDADERATPELKKEILDKLPDAKENAFAVPRRNFIFGKEFKHSGQYPDYQKRLFKISELIKWTGDVHEEPEFKGKLGYLKNPMIHRKNMTLSQMVEKTNKWSEIEAKLMFEAKHPPMNLIRFGTAMAREFWLRMIVQMAFLDGALGIIYAIYQVFSKFTSYAKLYERQIKKWK
jgi:glycosyltransferase involved in cell wall biosynthesis